jgi:hypothetical protein
MGSRRLPLLTTLLPALPGRVPLFMTILLLCWCSTFAVTISAYYGTCFCMAGHVTVLCCHAVTGALSMFLILPPVSLLFLYCSSSAAAADEGEAAAPEDGDAGGGNAASTDSEGIGSGVVRNER